MEFRDGDGCVVRQSGVRGLKAQLDRRAQPVHEVLTEVLVQPALGVESVLQVRLELMEVVPLDLQALWEFPVTWGKWALLDSVES